MRYYHPSQEKESHPVEGMDNLTREEAEAHCSDPDTSAEGEYFDGFVEE